MPADLRFADPAALGFDPDRLGRARAVLHEAARTGAIPAGALCVGRGGGVVEPFRTGRQHPDDERPIRPDALFLVASLTKPVVAVAILILVESGRLTLDDRVADFVPEFTGEGKGEVRLRHLLTHTSGLPDMLPENRQLRAAHAGRSAFVEGTCRHPLLFPAGTRVQYQSMGFALLGEIVERVEGVDLGTFLRERLFRPLGMDESWLGCPPEVLPRIAAVRLEPEQEGTDWGWNTPYWLGLGAPWGGLVTSPADLARFCRMMLVGGGPVLGPATVRAMTSNQLAGMRHVPEDDRRCRPWGLGWRLAWPGSSAHFGDLLGPRTYGHWGATGTLFWIDPDADAFAIVLTTAPAGEEGPVLARASNAVASALR